MTFSTSTISRITEELRLSQERVISLERETEEARASVAEWSTLLSYAETNPGQAASESGGELVAEAPGKPCFCGLPGVPGTLHGPNACVPADPASPLAFPSGRLDSETKFFHGLMKQAEEKVRGHFEPYAPPAASTEQPGGQA
ncbi:hypothetical protein [Streptosporangium sp. NPDC006930]|uniref:hypothetical protein n=1 Tax=Streptosporangium sp. NPDC006930 TaxID=3154783 RepID=UPI003446F2D9